MKTALAVVFFLLFTVPVAGGDTVRKESEPFQPLPSCIPGWMIEGTIARYTKDTLYEHINGESELYFPYGFSRADSARYISPKDPKVSIVADVYHMGSILDAFGIFSNYRQADAETVAIGSGGTVSEAQIMFYQGKYFIRLNVSGTLSLDRDVLVACAKAVSARVPGGNSPPPETKLLSITDISPATVRYFPESVLGYRVFPRGFVAGSPALGEDAKIFLILCTSEAEARETMQRYRAMVEKEGGKTENSGNRTTERITAVDPLYKKVTMERIGKYVAGIVEGGSDTVNRERIFERLRAHITKVPEK